MGASKSSPRVLQPYEVRIHDIANLILHALPILSDLTEYLEVRFSFRDRRWEFLQSFRTAATILSDRISAVEEEGAIEDFVDPIFSLARLLEELLDDSIIKATQSKDAEAESEPYPRLKAVQQVFPSHEDWASKFNHVPLIQLNRRKTVWRDLQDRLSKLTDLFHQFGEDLSQPQEVLKLCGPPEEGEGIRQLANITAIAFHCNHCKPQDTLEIRLRLQTFRSKSQSVGTSSLSLLVAQDLARGGWHEFSVHGRQQRRHSKVRIITGVGDRAQVWRASQPTRFPCICGILQKFAHRQSDWCRFHIELDPDIGGVQSHNPQQKLYKGITTENQLTLKHLLAHGGKDWSRFAKLSLAVILSYSLFYLYGSEWVSERWSRLNIFFFVDSGRMPLRPFLSSDPKKQSGPLSDPDGQHRYPEVLELGVILLEIHLGQDLESFLGREDPISEYDDLWFAAQEAFQMRRLHIESLSHREAIKKCLAPDFLMDSICDADALRTSLFCHVVHPLEEELRKTFKDELEYSETLDEVAEQKIDLGIVASTLLGPANDNCISRTAPKSHQPHIELTSQLQETYRAISTNMMKGSQPSGPKSRAWTKRELFRGQDEQIQPATPPSERTRHKATGESDSPIARAPCGIFGLRPNANCSSDWLSSLDELTATMKMRKTLSLANHAYHPIKIAVLDTGLKSNWRFGDDVTYRDFVDPKREDRVDNTLHGTMAVDLILQAYPEAELFVGRVFDTNQTDERTEPANLAKAIEWAAHEGVDIINISAGFRNDHFKLRKAIKQAHEQEILIFAAAANWGNAGPGVAFPAAIKDHVFCIFSCTGDLWASNLKMNPPGRNDADNFASLGESVSLYDDKAPLDGTSVAAPLAAGLAARILDFAKHADSRSAGCDEQQLRTRPGMRAVLKKMSKQDGLFRCIAPWLLWQHPSTPGDTQLGRERIQEVIREALNTLDR